MSCIINRFKKSKCIFRALWNVYCKELGIKDGRIINTRTTYQEAKNIIKSLGSSYRFSLVWNALFLGETFQASCSGRLLFFAVPTSSRAGLHYFSSGRQLLHLVRSPQVAQEELVLDHEQHTLIRISSGKRLWEQVQPPLIGAALFAPIEGLVQFWMKSLKLHKRQIWM